MTPKLDEALCRDFPSLYSDRHGSPMETCMAFGFPDDGWKPLIRRLSEKLSRLIAVQPDPQNFRAAQVKEKFGGLRFYMTCETDEMTAAIAEAEQ